MKENVSGCFSLNTVYNFQGFVMKSKRCVIMLPISSNVKSADYLPMDGFIG